MKSKADVILFLRGEIETTRGNIRVFECKLDGLKRREKILCEFLEEMKNSRERGKK